VHQQPHESYLPLHHQHGECIANGQQTCAPDGKMSSNLSIPGADARGGLQKTLRATWADWIRELCNVFVMWRAAKRISKLDLVSAHQVHAMTCMLPKSSHLLHLHTRDHAGFEQAPFVSCSDIHQRS
jgi:hypothetical protein